METLSPSPEPRPPLCQLGLNFLKNNNNNFKGILFLFFGFYSRFIGGSATGRPKRQAPGQKKKNRRGNEFLLACVVRNPLVEVRYKIR